MRAAQWDYHKEPDRWYLARENPSLLVNYSHRILIRGRICRYLCGLLTEISSPFVTPCNSHILFEFLQSCESDVLSSQLDRTQGVEWEEV